MHSIQDLKKFSSISQGFINSDSLDTATIISFFAKIFRKNDGKKNNALSRFQTKILLIYDQHHPTECLSSSLFIVNQFNFKKNKKYV